MTTQGIASKVELQFSDYYKQFKDFQLKGEYRAYWELCMEAVRDAELLGHIVFCNDLFRIPPVKTFLLYYEQELVRITGREDAALDSYVKRAIGAFWGMVFKVCLGYRAQESVSISLTQQFMVRTATCYMGQREKIKLDDPDLITLV